MALHSYWMKNFAHSDNSNLGAFFCILLVLCASVILAVIYIYVLLESVSSFSMTKSKRVTSIYIRRDINTENMQKWLLRKMNSVIDMPML